MNKNFFSLPLFLTILSLNINSSLAQMPDESFYIKQYKDQKEDCIKKRDYRCAAEALTKIIQIQQRPIDNYTELGMANYCLGNYQEAIGLFKKAIDLSGFPDADADNVDIADAYMFLGITYHTIGKDKEAKEEFNNALKYFEKGAELGGIIYIDVLLKEINKNTSK